MLKNLLAHLLARKHKKSLFLCVMKEL